MSDASAYLQPLLRLKPRVAVVLGSGLGAFADSMDDAQVIPYRDIPGWPQSTAIGHAGMLVVGSVAGVPVAALAGRAHLYEGYTALQAVYGVRALHELGVESLVLTNAAGGVNRDYKPGDLVLISDHINLLGQNPLSGPNDPTLGPRFPDMSEAYSKAYRAVALEVATQMGLHLREGVYAAVPGPSYETPAEIRYLRAIGADLVGMSTVPETIAANHMGMKVLGISCVTNHAAGVIDQKLDHKEVIEVGERMKSTLIRLLRDICVKL
ncbi:MAG: inosine guanosine and xanthosine phosphorylase family [Bryobacterales bacterium]|nr:inosine guanosine and xanthosine phosphorylase family [Bryobacterales bacterium]